jgi:signal transduction histidine kinase
VIAAIVLIELLLCAWLSSLALPVYGPTALFSLTVVALGVFVMVGPLRFALMVLLASLLHAALVAGALAPGVEKVMAIAHSLLAAAIACLAQQFLFAARRRDWQRGLEFRQLLSDLHRANEQMDDLRHDARETTARAAHDLLGPLKSLVALLRCASQSRDWREEPHAGLLREALATCVGVLDLSGRVLSDYREEKSGAGDEMEDFDLREPIWASVQAMRALAKSRRIPLVTRLPESPCPARGNIATLRAALECLLDNAIRYSPTSKPVAVELEAAEGRWNVSVIDMGPGIPERDEPRLFTRFYQASNRPASLPLGNGLGLVLARERMEALRGGLDFVPSPPPGAVFCLWLPR